MIVLTETLSRPYQSSVQEKTPEQESDKAQPESVLSSLPLIITIIITCRALGDAGWRNAENMQSHKS